MHERMENELAAQRFEMRALIYLCHDPLVSTFYRIDDVRQRRRCEAQAAARGWPVAELLVDAASEPAGAPRARAAACGGAGARLRGRDWAPKATNAGQSTCPAFVFMSPILY